MNANADHIRQGFGAVRPYLYGHLDLPDFVRHVFGAVEVERYEFSSTSFHVAARIGDSMVVMEVGDLPPDVTPTVASIYVYVDDVDGAYGRALDHGATSIAEPADKPYDERNAAVKDSFGNTWYISTYRGAAI